MKWYGNNYTLIYIEKRNGKIWFSVIDEKGHYDVWDGDLSHLEKILYYAKGLDINMPFEALQWIEHHPIIFVAKPKKYPIWMI